MLNEKAADYNMVWRESLENLSQKSYNDCYKGFSFTFLFTCSIFHFSVLNIYDLYNKEELSKTYP